MRKNIIKLNGKVIVCYPDNGVTFVGDDVDDKDFNHIKEAGDMFEARDILYPADGAEAVERMDMANIVRRVKESRSLTHKRDSVYWSDGSFELPVSMPVELVKVVLKAEREGDADALVAYKNFWTLMSLNKDERVRKNLFWFLKKWGMRIAKCGFFVGYRNVDRTPEDGVYTDHHSHSFKIRIGEVVRMDRSKCDPVQENQCSTGLHVGGAGWLKEHYFGDIGLAVLVNPADVVAVPYDSEYGKLRTCAYLPIQRVGYDKDGDIVPIDAVDGFTSMSVGKVIYEGVFGSDNDAYKIVIPELPGVPRKALEDELLRMAAGAIKDRTLAKAVEIC